MEKVGSLHHGFAQSGMRVDGQLKIRGQSTHFDSQNTFRNQFSRTHATNSHT